MTSSASGRSAPTRAAYRSCADRLRRSGVDLAGYSIPERVDDLELARRALGYRRIDLVSESAGTRTAMIYAWRYPKSIHRSVMIGVNPPGNFLWDAKTTGEQISRYATLCARDTSCRSRTPDLAASLNSSFARVPGHWLFLPIKKGDVRAAGFFGLINETSDGGGPIASPLTIDTLLSVDKGDASGAWFLSLMAQLVFPRAQVWGDVAAIGRSDATYAKRFFASGANRGSLIGSPGTDLIWAGGRILDAWPANPDENEYTQVQDSNVETLLIGGNLDFATPPQNATRELLPHLANGHQVVLSNLGHADDFWSFQPAASTRLLDTYLDSGKVDTSLYTRNKVDFSPSFSQGAIAKIVLGVLLGFAALTVLSLLWMSVRLCRQASFGRKGSAAGPVGVRRPPRNRRLVHRRARRPDGTADRSRRRPGTRSHLGRPPRRARRLLRLAETRLAARGEACRGNRGPRRRDPRRVARLPRSRDPAPGRGDRRTRGRRRREPRPDRRRYRTTRRAGGADSGHRRSGGRTLTPSLLDVRTDQPEWRHTDDPHEPPR